MEFDVDNLRQVAKEVCEKVSEAREDMKEEVREAREEARDGFRKVHEEFDGVNEQLEKVAKHAQHAQEQANQVRDELDEQKKQIATTEYIDGKHDNLVKTIHDSFLAFTRKRGPTGEDGGDQLWRQLFNHALDVGMCTKG